MRIQWRRPLFIIVGGIVAAFLVFVFINIILDEFRAEEPLAVGATFSTKYARELGIDPRAAFIASIDELGVKRFRIPVYWDEIEQTSGYYDFNELDWMVETAGTHGAELFLAIGLKVPRWPECHAPAWAHDLPEDELRVHLLGFLHTVVERYRENPTIIAWQVENEPLLDFFGECPPSDREFLKQEVALVRQLDNRPIIITESGEFSTWLRSVGIADVLGISMYRVSWNRFLGYVYYPLSPGYYRYRSDAVRPFVGDIVVTELQAEPWVSRGITQTPLRDQFRSMDVDRLRANLSFVRRSGFHTAYLWGVEWWYWLKETRDDVTFWNVGKEIFQQSAPQVPLLKK